MNDERGAHELLIESLNDEATLKSYKEPLDTYRPGLMPRLLGGVLIWCGNTVYGRSPSYLKFRAVEVIARVPYHSWSSIILRSFLCFSHSSISGCHTFSISLIRAGRSRPTTSSNSTRSISIRYSLHRMRRLSSQSRSRASSSHGMAAIREASMNSSEACEMMSSFTAIVRSAKYPYTNSAESPLRCRRDGWRDAQARRGARRAGSYTPWFRRRDRKDAFLWPQ